MRLGWMLLPSWLTWELTAAKTIEDCGSEVIGQLALSDFIARGELDRHVRRMRLRYQRRRETLLLERSRAGCPTARASGARRGPVRAGATCRTQSRSRCSCEPRAPGASAQRDCRCTASPQAGQPGLLLGYGNLSEPAIEQGVQLLGEAYRETTYGA